MKFSQNFSFYKIPEWSEYYFDYFSLKLILYYIAHGRNNITSNKERLKLKKLSRHISSQSNLSKKRIMEYIPSEAQSINRSIKTRGSVILKKGTQLNIQEINLKNLKNLEEMKNKMKKTEKNPSKDPEQNSLYLEEENEMSEEQKTEIMKKIDEMSGLPDTIKMEYFFQFYREKMKIVDKFFSNQIKNNEKKFLNIQSKMKQIKKNDDDSSEISDNIKSQLDNHERDELDFATSFKRALSTIYNFTSWLHSYHSINLLTIQKIQIKAIKVFKKHNIKDIEKHFEDENKKYKFFDNIKKIIELRKKIQLLYADGLVHGDIKKAKKELEMLLRGTSQVTQKKISCFYVGIIFIEILFYIFLCFNSKQRVNSVKPFFPSFNFSFCIILTFFGVAINLEILQRYKINYLYIFEVEPTLRIGSMEVLETCLCMLSIWFFFMICAKISYNYTLFGHIYYLFPLISSCSLLLFLFLPFNYFYYHFRMGIIHTFIRNCLPIGKKGVRFRDFFFGDILTSLSKAIVSLALACCLIFSCEECRKENKRIKKCNRDTIYCLIIQLYFPFVRVTQCLNRLYYTRDLWPHFANFMKYVTNMLNVYLSWRYSQNKTINNKNIYVTFGLFATTYQLCWDVYVDWGIGRPESKIFLLRDKIVYPRKFYYIAIILDGVIRFSWLLSFIDLNKDKFDEWKNLFLTVIEVYRRVQWCIIRIENENTTNPEKYRTILTIPDLPEF